MYRSSRSVRPEKPLTQRKLRFVALMILALLGVPGFSQVLNGNWNSASGALDQYAISWQEQSCGNNGISAYAIDVTVIGPRGVNPLR
jgi:hypothetical protein